MSISSWPPRATDFGTYEGRMRNFDFYAPFTLIHTLNIHTQYSSTMAQQPHRLGGNVALASLLALLSFIPFEIVAKGTLVISAFLFIVDPIPPLTRILAILSLFVVNLLSKLHSKIVLEQQEVIVVVDDNKKQD
jgi:hypothetical protein